VFWTGIKTTGTNRTFLKQTEKISQKRSLLEGLRKVNFFFSVRTETNRNSICFGCFSICFSVSDCYRNNRNKQNLWYGEIKRLIFEQICGCFCWSFVCFGCFETPKLPVLILKRNNRNKRLVLDSAETSFGSSFSCFDTKLVGRHPSWESYMTPSCTATQFFIAIRIRVKEVKCVD
jgi:hypothetical protein